MRSPESQILETALALQRAPGERFRLRQRPLPPGVIHVIEIAAGSPLALQTAATELGEPESLLLEAARFYLEQVLFADPDADAYRILGLGPDVPHEAIRTHHRWLQRWLHPDRAQAGDASIFATRVNQAFAQLRSPEARHSYDVSLAEARLAKAAAPFDLGTVRHWESEQVLPRYGQRSRWLLAAALASCLVLAVLVVRNPEKSAVWDPEGDSSVATRRADSAPAIDDRDLGVLSAALAVAPPSGITEAETEVKPSDVIRVPNELVAPGATTHSFPPTTIALNDHAVVAPAPVVSATVLHRAPKRTIRIADVVSAVSTVPAAQRPMSGYANPQAPVTQGESLAPAVATSNPPVPRVVADAEDPVVMFNRMRQAEQRVSQVTAYLSARPGAAPMWNDPQAEAEAARLRTQINARPGTKLELTRPAWKLQADSASLTADYRCRSAGKDSCEGRLDVKLVWREGLWLVRGVGLGPPA